jgi:adenylyltransferase/sulfurtransferase
MGVFAPLVGIIGSAQGAEALKILMSLGQPMIGRLSLFNATQFKWSEINYKKNPNCSVCAQRAQS